METISSTGLQTVQDIVAAQRFLATRRGFSWDNATVNYLTKTTIGVPPVLFSGKTVKALSCNT